MSACHCLPERAQPGGPLADCGFGLETGSQIYAVASRIPDPTLRTERGARHLQHERGGRASYTGDRSFAAGPRRGRRRCRRAGKGAFTVAHSNGQRQTRSSSRERENSLIPMTVIKMARNASLLGDIHTFTSREAKPAPHSASTGRKCVLLTRF